MSRSRAPILLGLTAAGGVGYYLYTSGGRPKVAEKQFESDVHKATAKAKEVLPHRGADAEKEGKKLGQEAGAKFDNAVAAANKEYSKAKSEAESYAKETKADTMKKIDEFDRKVEEGTSKAKSGISGWFGGK
ncbi:hypothetical protein QBC33DRAFT_566425 [Phialemonium atrogriseum]|uniref:Calcofluor white hypersensitive protein n=1 Tax=Phialemonium atrogriseum TaxID=1093897 RepID=A0AAJ0FKD9_9PEZI|nr:uncharacterized protein QBC33DRAFT_566425 [Phialemonium atrogriseum]KAK1770967.1 hypothetical protein QBC33DRAFT_566425 [Phialemonium atrogriseum]